MGRLRAGVDSFLGSDGVNHLLLASELRPEVAAPDRTNFSSCWSGGGSGRSKGVQKMWNAQEIWMLSGHEGACL